MPRSSSVRAEGAPDSSWAAAEELLADWERRARESQYCHYEAAKHFAGRNFLLGIPVVVLTSLVGTTVYATLQRSVSIWMQVGIGAVSVLAAVLAGLQTFLRYGERAEKHRTLGAQYGSVRRHLEVVKVLSPDNRGPVKEFLEQLRDNLDSLAQSAPDVPPRVWRRAEEKFRREEQSRAS